MQPKTFYSYCLFTLAWLLVCWFPCLTMGQNSIGIGEWRPHYPYNNARSVAITGNKVFSTSGLLLYYFDKEDNSLNSLSKKDGLSGVDITELASYQSKELIVGYADGNIDFIKSGIITPFPDIRRSAIAGSKYIHHFYIQANKLYASTDYGLSIINLAHRKEVAESYINISDNGMANPFYSCVLTTNGDSIFVASEKGLLGAEISASTNLRDYNSWQLYETSDGLPAGGLIKTLGCLNNVVYAGVNGHGVYYFNGTQWQASVITGINIKSIVSEGTHLTLCIDNKIYKLLSPSSVVEYTQDFILDPTDAVFENSQTVWLSDNVFGMLEYKTNGQLFFRSGNGPYTSDCFKLKYLNESIVNCPGALNTAFGPVFREGGFTIFSKEQQWSGYNRFGLFPDSRDVLDATYQASSGKWFFAAFNTGLITWNGQQSFDVFHASNSPLASNQVSSLTTAPDGKVWVGNTAGVGEPFLFSFSSVSGSWSSYFPNQNVGRYPKEIIVDQHNNKWVRLATAGGIRGLLVFNETINMQVYLGVNETNGGLPSIDVNTIEVDKTGQVWVGTNQGVAVYTNPSQIRPGNVPKAYLPIVDGFPLFFDKKINCIKVDGGNRKWIGTPDGVFLLSPDGTETILYFNTNNSPLINNNVVSITIQEETGEVFFGTDKGIISYRGDATTGGEKHHQVKVFPNPVEPGFDGWVGISGLVNNARVKIADVAGKLTYETIANGGTASWNVKDYNGRRAAAGVYLIFSSTEDGSETFVGKIAVLE